MVNDIRLSKDGLVVYKVQHYYEKEEIFDEAEYFESELEAGKCH